MEIEYKGANTLVLKSGQTTIVIDPKLSLAGGKDSKVDGLVEIVTEKRFFVDSGQKLSVTGPGEYEIGAASIKGIPAKRQLDPDSKERATIYKVILAGVRIAVLGHVVDSLTESQLEDIGVVDILTLPVGGGGYTLDAHGAAKLVRQIDPKVVIPTHYADSSLQYEVPQDGIELFVKELGAAQFETQSKLKIKNVSALPEVLTLIQLERS